MYLDRHSTKIILCFPFSCSQQTGMIESILMILMLSNQRYCTSHKLQSFLYRFHNFYALSVMFQGYDSIPAEIPDPKARKVC